MCENIEPRPGQDLEVLVIGTLNKKERYMKVYIVIHGPYLVEIPLILKFMIVMITLILTPDSSGG